MLAIIWAPWWGTADNIGFLCAMAIVGFFCIVTCCVKTSKPDKSGKRTYKPTE
jgi:hypothetical protein